MYSPFRTRIKNRSLWKNKDARARIPRNKSKEIGDQVQRWKNPLLEEGTRKRSTLPMPGEVQMEKNASPFQRSIIARKGGKGGLQTPRRGLILAIGRHKSSRTEGHLQGTVKKKKNHAKRLLSDRALCGKEHRTWGGGGFRKKNWQETGKAPKNDRAPLEG